jgi:hypothetical protein
MNSGRLKKTKYETNPEVLREWLKRNEPHPKQRLVQAAKNVLSVYLIDKMLAGHAPKVGTRGVVCRVTGIPHDVLFREKRDTKSCRRSA